MTLLPPFKRVKLGGLKMPKAHIPSPEPASLAAPGRVFAVSASQPKKHESKWKHAQENEGQRRGIVICEPSS